MEEFFCGPCLAAMPAGKFYMGLALASGAALIGLHQALRGLFKARLIEDIPTSRIRSASQGYVELIGLASGRGSTLASPLTASPCLWWRYTIERLERSGKSRRWRVVEKGHSEAPFFLDDGSGLCRIEPAGAEVSCLHRKRWEGSARKPGAAASANTGLIAALGRLASLGERYRYTEHLIRDGDPLYVLGHFESDATGARLLTIDQAAGRLIRQWKTDFPQLLVRFDGDGNGVLDSGEWQAVTAAARQAATREQRDGAAAPPDHSLRAPEDGGLPYLIGSHAQEQLARQFRWRAGGFALLFVAALGMAAWLVAGRFLG
ncbi:MAG: GIDE domain-containing protein [Porticoccaceae bacterium]|nr:GIDE domain-containing protein [Porticoccaceae bacterium]MEA3301367.1 GIDE domain-containing protein [Pseudomonadota bacterium]HLS98021.1 GIDE domain-containing protein [Porticoccaceae bacterium]